MKTLRVDLSRNSDEVRNVLPPETPRALALGYFDGIHRGHRELINKLLQRAAERGLEADVFSFDRYPKPVPVHAGLTATVPGRERPEKMILQSPLPPAEKAFKGLLQTQEQRDEIFAAAGLDHLILQAFNRSFAGLSAEDFLNKILLEKLNVKVLVTGAGYRFARGQEGDAALLRRWAAEHEVELYLIPPIEAGGEVISSSRIRALVEEGKMEEAGALLGRPFSIPGIVIRGNALGRTVGMPTANMRIPFGMVIPKFGVYVTRTRVGETYYDSVTNVGLRPTVNHTDPLPLVETCILDRRIDLYDKEIEVEFLKQSRDEERFPSFIAMSARIAEDLAEARQYHRQSEKLYRYTRVQDIPVYLFRSGRFNTAYLQIEFYLPLDEKTVSDHSLLTQVLTAVAPEYPSRPEFQSFLDAQYGASVEAWVSKVNELQKLTFRLSAVQRGLDNSEPFANCVDTFMSMLLRPVRDDQDHFLPNIIETERQNLLMEYLAGSNDKSLYAADRAEALLSEDPSEWLNPLGTREGLETADKTSLRDAWVRMLSAAGIRVYMYGSFDDCSLPDKVVHELASVPRGREALKLRPARHPAVVKYPEMRDVTEYGDVELAHLVMVFSGMPAYMSVAVLLGRILNYMLGESQQSLLFMEIRERLGYAYYVDSVYDSMAQRITVTAEVDSAQAEESAAVIMEQIERLRKGDYPPELFKSALKLYQNDLLQVRDDLEDCLEFDSHECLGGGSLSSEEVLHFTTLAAEDYIQKLAGRMKLRLKYLLLPESERPKTAEESKSGEVRL